MRKILVATVSAMALATAAHASNSESTITQAGNAQSATVHQEDTLAGKSISVIDQRNANNEAVVDQSSGANAGSATVNKSTINQTGTSGFAKVDQGNFGTPNNPSQVNISTIDQGGHNNDARVRQRGDGNNSDID